MEMMLKYLRNVNLQNFEKFVVEHIDEGKHCG